MTTLKAAREFAGRVSSVNSKMPGTSYATDAFACNVGSRLAKVEGSVCQRCYARRLQRFRPPVDKGWRANSEKSARAIAADPEAWAQAIAFQIIRAKATHHRWFDAGDLPAGNAGRDMLSAISSVCRMTPDVAHWLPTREISTILAWRKSNVVPKNLVIRLSAPMVGDRPMKAPRGIRTSTVHEKGAQHDGVPCEARHRGNKCGPCRACWDMSVANVSYPRH